jgi:hypothetical protein
MASWPRALNPRVSVAATATALGLLSGSIGCGHASHQACKGAPEPLQREWVVDGAIRSVVVVCGTVYVGGSFNSIGPPTGAAALVDAKTGKRLPFPVVDGDVRLAADDGRGGWFIGGDLKRVGGKPCRALAHVARGTLDWCPLRNGFVSALARDGRNLYVAYSAHVNAPARLASFDIRTRQRRAWAPSLGTRRPTTPCNPEEELCGPTSSVSALVARGGTVYIGGFFSSVSHSPLHDLAAVDGTTGGPLTFDATLATNTGRGDTYVAALALAGNVLYVGGGFGRIGGARRATVAAVDARSGAATPWAPRVARSSDTQAAVSAIAVTGSRVAIGGSFQRVNRARRRGFAVVTSSSAKLLPTQSPPRAQRHPVPVVALAANHGDVYLSGDGLNERGFESTYTAAVDARTGRPRSWNPSPNGPVRAIVASGRRVLLGGAFSSVNTVPRNGLAAIDSHGQVLPWHPQLVDENKKRAAYPEEVHTLLASGNTLYAGGSFVQISGKPRFGLAAFSLPSLRLLPWRPAMNHDEIFEGVKALAARDGDGVVYAVGDFTSINGVRRDGAAAIDASSGHVLPWNPPPADVGVLYTVAVTDDTVFLGGNPSTGTTVLAAVDKDNGEQTRWTVDWSGADGVSEVRALVPTDDSVYAAGAYLPDHAVARFDRDDGRPLPLGLSARPFIDAMVQNGSNVYVRLEVGRVAVIDAQTGHVRRSLRVCPVSDDEVIPTMAVTESRLIVNCIAAGGTGERLVVSPLDRRG